ncbi:MAG TPA: ABC transporter ATP-binding protein [Gammaproteobacteria bacterium]|nr:ABC transporter ATP-binding protein [Gammaproteobacteria bacterium]
MHAGYGGTLILKGVDLQLQQGQIGVIAGPNGAGKSTLLKSIFGLLTVHSGSIQLAGELITNVEPNVLVKRGMAFVPQEKNVFESLSVEENLQMGAYLRRDNYNHLLEKIYADFPPLAIKRKQPAGELSGGQRQMVAIARALMMEPRLILLDEPTAGLSPLFMEEIFAQILGINADGVSVLMVEQNARQALTIADQGFILTAGKNRYTDSGQHLLQNPEVAKSFLGG